MPAGVFNPYSGVKTSVLILDKNLNKKIKDIFFIEIKNDGFSLNSNRNKIEGSEIGKKIELIQDFYNNKKSQDLQNINKKDILDTDDVIFNFNRFIKKDANETKHLVKLNDVVDVLNGFAFESKNYSNSGYRILRITNVQKGQIVDNNPRFHLKLEKDSEHKKFNIEENEILVSLTGNVGRVGMVDKDLLPAYLNQRVAKIKQKSDNKNNIKFLFHILNSEYFEKEAIINSFGVAQKNLSTKWISNFQIPLPSIETQNQIVDELDGHQKIIDGCRLVIENYRPSIDVEPNWEVVDLGSLVETEYGTSNKSLKNGKVPVLRMGNLQNGEIDFKNLVFSNDEKDIKKFKLKDGDLLFNRTNSPELVGKCSIFRGYSSPIIFAGYLIRMKLNRKKILPDYLNSIMNSYVGLQLKNKFIKVSGNQANINASDLRKYLISLPPILVQEEIVKKFESEREIVNQNKILMNTMRKKISNKINSMW